VSFGILVRPRGKSVGFAPVASAGCRLFGGMSGRVENNFDAFVLKGCEEPADSIGASVGRLCAEEPGVDHALGDFLLLCEGLFAL
jgi:hypothetical protein